MNNTPPEPIYVTEPHLPPLSEFIPYLQSIWDSKRLTNGGPFHELLEEQLATYLGVKYVSLFANGTLALMTALQTLKVSGEVITTPFTFAATAHSLIWNNLTPVFVDIDPDSCNLDPLLIEKAITPSTTAIMPVHCYGFPCDIDAIERIANTYGLKVIYDAAHSFGVQRDRESILNAGDLSVLSFHATKVFNTLEGGAIISPTLKLKQRVDYLKNFGFANELTIVAPGINGKMNEVQAALGLLQLKHIDSALANRKSAFETYKELLAEIPSIQLLTPAKNTTWNFAYCPVRILKNHRVTRDGVYANLKSNNIYARRYFHPLISSMPMYMRLPSASKELLPKAQVLANEIICLPLYPSLSRETIQRIVKLV